MNIANLCCLALLGVKVAIATPVHISQEPFRGSSSAPEVFQFEEWVPNSDEDRKMSALLDRYAPVFKLSKEEQYFPSMVDYMLPHYSYMENTAGDIYPANHSTLTPSHLDDLPLAGTALFLSISEPHNPQPFLADESSYLFGPAGQDGAMEYVGGRGRVKEPVYGFWVDQGRGVIDLWYWTFYPFNFGKPAGRFGVLGNHVADWEHFRMRLVNGTPVSGDFATHEGGRLSAGTVRWDEIEKNDERPVAYVARGSHGIWPEPGEHVYAEIANLFKIVDSTDDEGALWDTKHHVIPVRYWDDNVNRNKVLHTQDDSWRNFKGWWGNKGENDCWWHGIVGICQVVDAPPGPNRNFGTPPECLIAPVAEDHSTYSFYLSSPAVDWAIFHDVTMVQVEQICERPRRSKDDGGEEVDQGDVEVTSTRGLTLFRGTGQHTTSPPACTGRQSAVRGYRVSLCLHNGKCLTTSRERPICAYQLDKKGYGPASAVKLDDIDDWRWDY